MSMIIVINQQCAIDKWVYFIPIFSALHYFFVNVIYLLFYTTTLFSSKTTPIKQKIKPKTSTDINLRLLNVPSAKIQISKKVIKSPSVKKTKTFSPRKATKEYNSDKETSNDNGFDISDISDLDLYQNEEESFSSCDI